MKRLILIFVILIYGFLIPDNSSAQTPYKIKKVVIDAGHGGKDPGCSGKIYKEKNVSLAVALKLGKLITDNFSDVEVIYTRSTDIYPELWERSKIANDNHADLFISIHCNSNPSPLPVGTETYVIGVAKSSANLKVAQKENAVILNETNYQSNYKNFDPYSDESYIIFNLFQSVYRDQSLAFAVNVENQFSKKLNRYNRGVKEAGFLVLWQTTMPSVLIEIGFLSNPEEEKYLGSVEGQNDISMSIFKAFSDYKKTMEKDSKSDSSIVIDTTSLTNKNDSNAVAVQQPQKDEIIFSVQFKILQNKVNANSFKEVEDVWFYIHQNQYKYLSGKENNMNAAIVRMKKIQNLGYKDAFVVAFKNGERIDPKVADAILRNK